MTARVSLSLRAARELLGATDGSRPRASQAFARDELAAAIAKAQRTTATRRALRKPKEAKKRAKRDWAAEVRVAVVERARGQCEGCPNQAGAPLQLDHFFGRARAESVESCWLLCSDCHHWKTRNHPSAAFWLEKFIQHCVQWDYSAEAAKARARLAFVEARGGAF